MILFLKLLLADAFSLKSTLCENGPGLYLAILLLCVILVVFLLLILYSGGKQMMIILQLLKILYFKVY